MARQGVTDVRGAGPNPRNEITPADLEDALADDRFVVHYQPCVELLSGRMVSAEALVRLTDRQGSLIPPDRFVPVAESSGLIVPIGARVMEHAARRAVEWSNRTGSDFRTWVNLSSVQIADGAALVETVRSVLAGPGIFPHHLGLEVTESLLMDNVESASEALSTLRQMGVDLALDDFGTGYSSLAYLKRLPVTALKIDRSFVSGVDGSLADGAIVQAVIELAHSFGLSVVAEGVESFAQAVALRGLDVERAQGYYFSRPVDADAFVGLLGSSWCGHADMRPGDGLGNDLLPGGGGPRTRLLLSTLDSIADAVMVLDHRADTADLRTVYVNPSFERQTGFSAAELLGKASRAMGVTEQAGRLAIRTAISEGRSETAEVIAVRKDGSSYPCEITVSPLRDRTGHITNWITLRRDLTARKALEDQRAVLDTVLRAGPTAVLLVAASGNVTYANEATSELLGVPPDAVIGRPIAELFLPSIPASIANCLSLTPGVASVCEAFVRSSTAARPVPVTIAVQRLEANTESQVVVFLRDEREERQRIERRRIVTDFADQVRESMATVTAVETDLSEMLERTALLLDADMAFVDLVDPETGELVPGAAWERRSGRIKLTARIAADLWPLWRQTLDAGQPIISRGDEAERGPGLRERDRLFGSQWACEVAIPLRVRGTTYGVFVVAVAAPRMRQWDPEVVAFLCTLGDSTANLIARHQIRNSVVMRQSELVHLVDKMSALMEMLGSNDGHRATTGTPALERLRFPDPVLGS